MSLTLKPYADLDIIHTLNDDVNIKFTRQDLDGTAVNITGYTYTFTIRDERGGTAVDTIPMVITDASNGMVYARGLKANLSISAKNYVFDIEENDGTYATTKFKGLFKVEKE